MTAPLIRMRGITKRFPGVLALDGVDFELAAGEVHALTGENGSGKSTLAKILYGAHRPDAGTIEIDGEPIEIGSPARALQAGIVAISQELTLAPTLTVAENVLMGRLPRTRLGVLDWRAARRLAGEALALVGAHVDPSARVGDLSVELQQEVEIARAVSARSRVLILDEATSSLSEAATAGLLRRVELLRRSGVAVIMISHRMAELYSAATRATVLRDGRLAGTVDLSDTPEEQLVRLMVGRDLENLYAKRAIDHGEVALEVDGLRSADGVLRGVSFAVRRGEILGVAGLVGSGKAELGLCLGGAIPSAGVVRVAGAPAGLKTPTAAIASGIGFVPDDRKRSALLPTRSVGLNLSVAWTSRMTRLGLVQRSTERRMVDDAMRELGVVASSPDVAITTLSGGNQQKVVLGRWFALGLDVLVLSEPTRGIDVGAKSEVYRLVQDVAERGAAVVVISSELPELLGLTDRILVMAHGEVRAELVTADTDEETVAHAAVSGPAAQAA